MSFSDFAPYMILTEASLAALNKELQTPVPMKRFRPNVVVSGLGAFEEMVIIRFRVQFVIYCRSEFFKELKFLNLSLLKNPLVQINHKLDEKTYFRDFKFNVVLASAVRHRNDDFIYF